MGVVSGVSRIFAIILTNGSRHSSYWLSTASPHSAAHLLEQPSTAAQFIPPNLCAELQAVFFLPVFVSTPSRVP